MQKIDARGKTCPEPVIMTRAVVEKGAQEIEVSVDNPISAANVKRYLKTNGYEVRQKDESGTLTVTGHRKGDAASPAAEADVCAPTLPPGAENFSVLITAQYLGRSDVQLGEVLMKSFLGTLSQMDNCVAVALMNEGVKLALRDSSTCDHLKALTDKEVSVLVCGTCVNHFNLVDQIGVGTISNMFEIVESLNKAHKAITL